MSTILEKNKKGNIALVRNIEQKQYDEISRQLKSVNNTDFKKLLSMQLENNKTILHTVFYSGDTQIISKFLNKVIELKLTTEDIKEFFEKSNNAHKTPLTILLKKPAALNTFLEAVNATGDAKFIFDVYNNSLNQLWNDTYKQKANDLHKNGEKIGEELALKVCMIRNKLKGLARAETTYVGSFGIWLRNLVSGSYECSDLLREKGATKLFYDSFKSDGADLGLEGADMAKLMQLAEMKAFVKGKSYGVDEGAVVGNSIYPEDVSVNDEEQIKEQVKQKLEEETEVNLTAISKIKDLESLGSPLDIAITRINKQHKYYDFAKNTGLILEKRFHADDDVEVIYSAAGEKILEFAKTSCLQLYQNIQAAKTCVNEVDGYLSRQEKNIAAAVLTQTKALNDLKTSAQTFIDTEKTTLLNDVYELKRLKKALELKLKLDAAKEEMNKAQEEMNEVEEEIKKSGSQENYQLNLKQFNEIKDTFAKKEKFHTELTIKHKDLKKQYQSLIDKTSGVAGDAFELQFGTTIEEIEEQIKSTEQSIKAKQEKHDVKAQEEVEDFCAATNLRLDQSDGVVKSDITNGENVYKTGLYQELCDVKYTRGYAGNVGDYAEACVKKIVQFTGAEVLKEAFGKALDKMKDAAEQYIEVNSLNEEDVGSGVNYTFQYVKHKVAKNKVTELKNLEEINVTDKDEAKKIFKFQSGVKESKVGEKVKQLDDSNLTTAKVFDKSSALMASKVQKFSDNIKKYDFKNLDKNIDAYENGACAAFKLISESGEKECTEENIVKTISTEFCAKTSNGGAFHGQADTNAYKLFCAEGALTAGDVDSLSDFNAYDLS
jgi:hypothetical protein